MQFNNYYFIVAFLPFVLALYCGLARFFSGGRASRLWLVAASLGFYGASNRKFLALFVASMAANFALGWALQKRKGRSRQVLVWGGVAANLALLCYFKYASAVFPLALSFYTFQQIVFLLDVHNGTAGELSALSYANFLAFFPYLTSGPISRYHDIAPQFKAESSRRWDSSRVLVGLTIFFIGLFKKQIFAEAVAGFADTVFAGFSQGTKIGALAAWAASTCYALQLYFDFSGYSDMAVGVAWVFGIRIPLNFSSPYKATNIMDFWRRWHMTLSGLIMAFVFTPMATVLSRFASRNRIKGMWQQLLTLSFPAILTFAIVGAWHGSGWTFVAFGLMHGVLFALNLFRKKFKNRTLTYLAVIAAFAVFRSENLRVAGRALRGLFGANGLTNGIQMVPMPMLAWLTALTALVWLAPNTREILGEHYPALSREKLAINPWSKTVFAWRPTSVGIAASAAVTVGAILGLGVATSFIYFRF